MTPPVESSGDTIRRLALQVQKGNVEAPRAEAEALLSTQPRNAPLWRFLGLLHCQTDDLPRGIEMLETALMLDPADRIGRRALVQALADSGAFTRARALCTAEALSRGGEPLWRLLGHIERAADRPRSAAQAFERVLNYRPEDAVCWRHLADARHADGDLIGATAALRRAFAFDDDPAIGLQLASALVDGGASAEAIDLLKSFNPGSLESSQLLQAGKLYKCLGFVSDALRLFELSSSADMVGADPLVEIGLIHVDEGSHSAAETAYLEALNRDQHNVRAYFYLGLLLEHSNRWQELGELVAAADAIGVARTDIALLHAHVLRRSGRHAEALGIARLASEAIEPARRAQLIGELADRLGDGAAAFGAFSEMNRLMAAGMPGARQRAMLYRATVEERLANSAAVPPPAGMSLPGYRASPTFLLGLPRSGTTLLDTLLMGHPAVAVLEEPPIIQHIDAEIGGIARLPNLTAAELTELRLRYFRELEALNGPTSASHIIDKHPLHIAYLPLIERLFPDARLIFIARHPCDVVLSCFTTNFATNDAMANFLDLRDAATFCDLLMRCWTQWSAGRSEKIAVLHYEALVESPEREMRRLLPLLGLEWSNAVLDHQTTAARRGYIASASYAQVGEAIHARSVGRWQRYRAELAPVLPVLAPWVAELGYTL